VHDLGFVCLDALYLSGVSAGRGGAGGRLRLRFFAPVFLMDFDFETGVFAPQLHSSAGFFVPVLHRGNLVILLNGNVSLLDVSLTQESSELFDGT
jgi:hypothetical protein